MREKLESLPLAEIKEIAKQQGIKGITKLKKNEIIDKILEAADNDNGENIKNQEKQETKSQSANENEQETDNENRQKANGILEVMPDGYGFIRCENFLPGENDVYVSPSQIRRFRLKKGEAVTGDMRPKSNNEKIAALPHH